MKQCLDDGQPDALVGPGHEDHLLSHVVSDSMCTVAGGFAAAVSLIDGVTKYAHSPLQRLGNAGSTTRNRETIASICHEKLSIFQNFIRLSLINGTSHFSEQS